MNFPVHSYGTGNIPTMVAQMGQMMFKKKEQERQDKKDLLLLKERQKNTAFDQGMKLLNIYPKYEETAPAAARKIASQAGQFFKASGYEFDLSTLKDAGEAKELVKTQSVERMEAISKTMFKAPKKGQAVDLGGNINALATSVRQAKQAGVSKEVTDIYEKYIADARKRQAEIRTEGRRRPEIVPGAGGRYIEKKLGGKAPETGKLTENQVTQNLLNLSFEYPDTTPANIYKQYREERKKGKSREEAYDVVLSRLRGDTPGEEGLALDGYDYLWNPKKSK